MLLTHDARCPPSYGTCDSLTHARLAWCVVNFCGRRDVPQALLANCFSLRRRPLGLWGSQWRRHPSDRRLRLGGQPTPPLPRRTPIRQELASPVRAGRRAPQHPRPHTAQSYRARPPPTLRPLATATAVPPPTYRWTCVPPTVRMQVRAAEADVKQLQTERASLDAMQVTPPPPPLLHQACLDERLCPDRARRVHVARRAVVVCTGAERSVLTSLGRVLACHPSATHRQLTVRLTAPSPCQPSPPPPSPEPIRSGHRADKAQLVTYCRAPAVRYSD